MGASKRGWLAYLIAATKCEICGINVKSITPLVPIVPDLIKDIHRQWQSYNGFSFAFKPFTDVGLTPVFDSDKLGEAFKVIDPVNYLDRLEDIPKFVVVSSDDEFMSMDWTNIYWEKMPGESHLLIAPNSEHIMVTGIYDILKSVATFIRSNFAGITERPTFTHTYNPESGEVSVTIPKNQE